MYCLLKDFYFTEDKGEIIDFYKSERRNHELMDYIECYE